MLSGLEISEILLSNVIQDNEKYRLDSEFFGKKFLEAYQKIKSINNTTIEKELKVLTDFHSNGSYETISKNFKLLDEKDYAYMVRTTDLETNNFSEKVKYISKSTYDFLSKSKVFGQEVLINKIGSPGRTYIMPKLDMPVSLGMNLFLLRLKGKNIDENTLYLFLNSEIGRNIIQRKVNGTVPLTIDKKAIKSLYVPIFSYEFRSKLNNLICTVNEKSKNARLLYNQAENLLVCELGLENFEPSSEKVSIKTLKESFVKTGRLDSEYYQVKYDEYLQKIKLNKHTTISNEFELIKEKMKNGLGSYNYIEIGDVNVSDGKSIPKLIDEKDLPANAKIMPQKGDLLVSKVRPNRGAISIIEENYSNLIVSGAFTVLREKEESDYKVETLKTLLRSPIYSDWLLKFNVGTSYPVIADEDILSLPIPIIKFNVQDKIVSYIKQSMEYSKKAKELLDISIRAVEIAIEKDEQTAQSFLDRQIDDNFLL